MSNEKTVKELNTPKPNNTADWIAYLDEKVEAAWHGAAMSLITQRDAAALRELNLLEDRYSEIEKARPKA